MTDRAPYLPWTPEWSRLAVRGRVIVKVASGEAPDRVPHTRDVAVALGRHGHLERTDQGRQQTAEQIAGVLGRERCGDRRQEQPEDPGTG